MAIMKPSEFAKEVQEEIKDIEKMGENAKEFFDNKMDKNIANAKEMHENIKDEIKDDIESIENMRENAKEFIDNKINEHLNK